MLMLQPVLLYCVELPLFLGGMSALLWYCCAVVVTVNSMVVLRPQSLCLHASLPSVCPLLFPHDMLHVMSPYKSLCLPLGVLHPVMC
jgi:hypothetical protein